MIEIISSNTILSLLIFNSPKQFIINFIIILLITSVLTFLKYFYLSYYIFAISILTLAVCNKVIVLIRGVPITYSDFALLGEAFNMIQANVNILIIFSLVYLITFILLGYYIYTKEVKSKLRKCKVTIKTLLIYSIYFTFSLIIILCNQFDKSNIDNISKTYNNNGFIYSLIYSGIQYNRIQPIGYNKLKINNLKKEIRQNHEVYIHKDENPNIILVQLESFYDLTLIPNINFNIDPIPNFRKLTDNFTSGILTVPTYGGGTARTEFEVLTGLSIKNLALGEIPHKTFLQNTNIFTFPKNLRNQGYATNFYHNYIGDFYNRNKVYQNFGFDSFNSIEYLPDYSISVSTWPSDESLIDPIINTLKQTEEKDFVFVMTMESHWPYSDKESDYTIQSSSNQFSKKVLNQINYYANLIHNVDNFIGNLIEQVSSIDEKTIILFYSDHLPKLDIFDEYKETINLYETQFAIYDNFGLLKKDFNMNAYELSARIIDLLQLKKGPIEEVHTYLMNNTKDDLLQLIQYDMLFGKKYFYNSEEIDYNSVMKLGFNDIKINEIYEENQALIIMGENFNIHSQVFIDDVRVDTEYINNTMLKISIPNNWNNISVKQLTYEGNILSSSNKLFR